MAKILRFNIEGLLGLDASGMLKKLGEVKTGLDKLSLPLNIEKNLDSLFTKLSKEVEDFERLSKRTFTDPKEPKEAEKSYQRLTSLVKSLSLEMDKVGESASNLKIKDPAIAKGLEKVQTIMKDLETRTDTVRTHFERLINSFSSQKALAKVTDVFNADDLIEAIKKGASLSKVAPKLMTATALPEGVTFSPQLIEDAKRDAAQYQKEIQEIEKTIETTNTKYQEILDKIGRQGTDKNLTKTQRDTYQNAEAFLEGKAKELELAAEKLEKAQEVIDHSVYKELKGTFQDFSKVLKNIDYEEILGPELSERFKDVATEATSLEDFLARLSRAATEGVKPAFEQAEGALGSFRTSVEGTGQEVNRFVEQAKDFEDMEKRMLSLQSQMLHFLSLTSGWNLFRKALRNSVETIKELDAAMTEIAVVSDYTVGQVWKMRQSYSDAATDMGAKTVDLIEATKLYTQQGLDLVEAQKVAIETVKMARIANLSGEDSTNLMTAAIRGFHMELTEANRVNDVYSNLAAKSAADTREIAVAISKTASLAASANATFENTSAFLTQIIETTRESPETAGTALKTIIARFNELKKPMSEIGEVDGEIVDANKIETALRSAGVELRKATGEFRDFDDVIIELSSKWQSLDMMSQRYIATMAAGSRQQSRFLALVSDNEQLTRLLGYANDSAGASAEQFNKTLESLEARLNRLSNAVNIFYTNLANSEIVNTVIDLLTKLVELVNKVTGGFEGFGSSIASVVLAVGTFKLLGSAIKLLFTKLVPFFLKSGQESGAQYATGFGQGIAQGSSSLAVQAKKLTKDFDKVLREGFKDKKFLTLPNLTTLITGNTDPAFVKAHADSIGALYVNSISDYVKRNSIELSFVDSQALNTALQEFQQGLAVDGNLTAGLDVLENKLNSIGSGALQNVSRAATVMNAQLMKTQQTIQLLNGALGAIILVLGLLSTYFRDLGLTEVADNLQKVASTGMIFLGLLNLLKYAIPLVTKALSQLGIVASVSFGWIAVIAAAITGIIMAIGAIQKYIYSQSLEGRLEKAKEATEAAEKAAKDARSAYDNLLSSSSKYDELQEKIDGLTTGTLEWRDAIHEANAQALQLVKDFPSLGAHLQVGAGGRITLSPEGMEEAKAQGMRTQQQLDALELFSQLQEQELKNQQTIQEQAAALSKQVYKDAQTREGSLESRYEGIILDYLKSLSGSGEFGIQAGKILGEGDYALSQSAYLELSALDELAGLLPERVVDEFSLQGLQLLEEIKNAWSESLSEGFGDLKPGDVLTDKEAIEIARRLSNFLGQGLSDSFKEGARGILGSEFEDALGDLSDQNVGLMNEAQKAAESIRALTEERRGLAEDVDLPIEYYFIEDQLDELAALSPHILDLLQTWAKDLDNIKEEQTTVMQALAAAQRNAETVTTETHAIRDAYAQLFDPKSDFIRGLIEELVYQHFTGTEEEFQRIVADLRTTGIYSSEYYAAWGGYPHEERGEFQYEDTRRFWEAYEEDFMRLRGEAMAELEEALMTRYTGTGVLEAQEEVSRLRTRLEELRRAQSDLEAKRDENQAAYEASLLRQADLKDRQEELTQASEAATQAQVERMNAIDKEIEGLEAVISEKEDQLQENIAQQAELTSALEATIAESGKLADSMTKQERVSYNIFRALEANRESILAFQASLDKVTLDKTKLARAMLDLVASEMPEGNLTTYLLNTIAQQYARGGYGEVSPLDSSETIKKAMQDLGMDLATFTDVDDTNLRNIYEFIVGERPNEELQTDYLRTVVGELVYLNQITTKASRVAETLYGLSKGEQARIMPFLGYGGELFTLETIEEIRDLTIEGLESLLTEVFEGTGLSIEDVLEALGFSDLGTMLENVQASFIQQSAKMATADQRAAQIARRTGGEAFSAERVKGLSSQLTIDEYDALMDQFYLLSLEGGEKAVTVLEMISTFLDESGLGDEERAQLLTNLTRVNWKNADSWDNLSKTLIKGEVITHRTEGAFTAFTNKLKAIIGTIEEFDMEKTQANFLKAQGLLTELTKRDYADREFTREERDELIAMGIDEKKLIGYGDSWRYVGDSANDLTKALTKYTRRLSVQTDLQLYGEKNLLRSMEKAGVSQVREGDLDAQRLFLSNLQSRAFASDIALAQVPGFTKQTDIGQIADDVVETFFTQLLDYFVSRSQTIDEDMEAREETALLRYGGPGGEIRREAEALGLGAGETRSQEATQALLYEASAYKELTDEIKAYNQAQKAYDRVATTATKTALDAAKAQLSYSLNTEKSRKALGLFLTTVEGQVADLKKAEKGSFNYQQILEDITSDFNNLLDLDVASSFFEDAKNFELLEKTLGRSEEALQDLMLSAIKSRANIGEFLRETGIGLEYVDSIVQALDGTTFNINGEADLTNVINALIDAGATAAEVARFISSLSGAAVNFIAEYDADGNIIGGHLKTEMPRTSDFKPIKSKGGGGGKKGGGGKDQDPWEADYDWLYNIVEQTNELLRQRNRMETEHGRILSRTGTQMQDIYKNMQDQLANLKQQRDLYDQQLKGRMKEQADIEKEYSDLLKYAWYDETSGYVQIDWDAINALSGTKGNNETGERIDEYIKKLEEVAGKIDSVDDSLYDIIGQIEDIYELGKDQYLDLETRVYDALINAEQKQIDELSNIHATIDDANAKVLDKLQQSIDETRRIRDNQEKEEELAKMERRMSFLLQDTSGANQMEILKLQEQIDEARQGYTDDLIDQKISELQLQNDAASEQRQRQIEIMQAQLDFAKDQGWFWENTYDLLSSGIDMTGQLVTGSDLVNLLQSEDGFLGLSKLAKVDWLEELQDLVAEGISYLALNRSLDKLGISSGTISFATRDGKLLTGTVGTGGKVTTADGKVYSGVYQMYDGTFRTNESFAEATAPKIEAPPSAPEVEAPTSPASFPYGKASKTSGTIKKGARGNSVRAIQFALSSLGYKLPKYGIDGVFGTETERALKRFQKDMKISADGIVGSSTRSKFAMKGYASGGLNTETGPAILHGTKAKPELVLNAMDTRNFMELREAVADWASKGGVGQSMGDVFIDVTVEVDSIANDYDVDQMISRTKKQILEDSLFRNVVVVDLAR